tara:strand:+ start:1 stop:1242 length:1242 start_codon:yes stop_codon:yes gene_type:complete
MWKEILKESRTVKFTPSLKYGILKYVNDNIPEGTVISFRELSMGEPFEQIKLFALKHFRLLKGTQAGGIGGYLKYKGPGQVGQKGGLMCYNAGIVDYEQVGRGKKYTRNSTMKEYNFDGIVSKAKDYGKERATTYILKGRRDNYKIFRDALHQAAFRVMEREPSGMKFTVADLIFREEEIVEIAKTSIPTRLLGGFAQFRKNKFKGQMQSAAKKMVSNGLADRAETSRVSYILKGWQPGPKPKKLTPEMEEDIEEVVGDNEFTVSDKLSDKIKQILMETPEGKPAKTKEDIKEFNRRFPGLKTNIVIEDDDDDIEDMDTGCGCGCDGKEVTKASSKCTKRTKKASSTRKGKKWMACVPNGKGGYKRVHWGQRGVSVTGKRGNTKRKKSFRARHKCSTCKGGDYSARCMACRDW